MVLKLILATADNLTNTYANIHKKLYNIHEKLDEALEHCRKLNDDLETFKQENREDISLYLRITDHQSTNNRVWGLLTKIRKLLGLPYTRDQYPDKENS